MTIEELRRARLAAKLEAGGIGGYAEAKRKAEMEAEAKVEESPFFDPSADGKMTAEQRQAVLTAKLKELGDYGVKCRTVEESSFFDPPVEIDPTRSTLAHPSTDEPKEKVISTGTKTTLDYGESSEYMRVLHSVSIRTLTCIECKYSGYGHLLFRSPARCVFVPQKLFCATKRLAPGTFSPRQLGSKVTT